MPPPPRSDALRRLARAAQVAVEYDASGSVHQPSDATLRAVLAALGHRCDDEAAARQSLRALRLRPWTRQIDPVAVVWRAVGRDHHERTDTTRGPARVTLSAPASVTPQVWLTLEDGRQRSLPTIRWGGHSAAEDRGARRRGTVALSGDLPLGYHRLQVDDGAASSTCTVVVAPDAAPAIGDTRRWGWMLQLYAVRSAASWGQGEYRDLGALATWSAGQGADFLLINPVHASAPGVPRQASPYSPTSRRFFDPCYLYVPDVDGFAALPADDRDRLTRLPPALAPDADRIDRDAIWAVKRAALWAVFVRRDGAARTQLATFRTDGGAALERFAVFCSIAEQHGNGFQRWPAHLQDPTAPAVARWASDHDELVAFHAWLQLHCTRQLHGAQRRATDAGMAIGVLHDLAVGVDAGSADVWALPEEFARSMRVGAPPDAFNQQGQNWGQPPPVPDVMRARGYQTQREILSAALTVGGGLRIDHILGLSRLFWIPDGASPSAGTYVRYPVAEQFAVLTLEAHRAEAIVVGEDLGTVDERVRRLMRRSRIAGSAVLYFERDAEKRVPAQRYPTAALASVTTHDLPTATGWWDGSALELRDTLGLLTQTRAVAAAELAAEQTSLTELLIDHGVLADAGTAVRQRVLAMYRFLASTPSRLVAVALWDAVGDPRQPNVPGTVDTYPNWCLPLSVPTPAGPQPVTLERLMLLGAIAEMGSAIDRPTAP